MANVLEITAGNDEDFEIVVTEVDPDTEIETAVDITGYTFFFTAKEQNVISTDADDNDALVKVTWTDHSVPLEGKTVLLIPNASTRDLKPGDLWFGIKYKTAGGIIKNLELGTDTLRVRRQVTNRIS